MTVYIQWFIFQWFDSTGCIMSCNMQSTNTRSLLTSCIISAKALMMSVCIAPRFAVILNLKSATKIASSMLPADRRMRPCVISNFLAAGVLVTSVFMPSPRMCSLTGLLVDRSGLSVVVFQLSLVGGVAVVELVRFIVGGMLGSIDGGLLVLLLCLGSVLCWAPTPLGVFWRCWCCGFGVPVGVPLGTGPRSDLESVWTSNFAEFRLQISDSLCALSSF
jgi:hypothetical protein